MIWQTIGFDKNKNFFETIIKNSQLGHAYLFTGQEMIGKRTFALELANQLSGSTTKYLVVEPLSNPDILFVNSASSESGQTIAIDEVRKIKNFVSLSLYAAGPYKFVIIDDAHLMTTEAQNALLKVLEEPNPSSILILITANPELLLPTILSRCQEERFAPHLRAVIENFLADSKLSKTKTDFLIDFANGRLGLVKSIVENNSFDKVKNSVEELMRLIKIDINERLTVAQKLTDEKNKPRNTTSTSFLSGNKTQKGVEVDIRGEAELPKKILYWTLYLRTRLNEPKAHKILKNLLALHEIISKPQFNQRLALENFLVSL